MGEIKFRCRMCEIPLAVDESCAGEMIACPNCKCEIQVPKAEGDFAVSFVAPSQSPPQTPLTYSQSNSEGVVIVDIQMKFWSMVRFMVKWAIASIPAVVILFAIGLCVVLLTSIATSSYESYSRARALTLERQHKATGQPASTYQPAEVDTNEPIEIL